MQFGKDIKENYLLSETTSFTNHGSFGAIPRPVFEQRNKCIEQMERSPDVWFRCLNELLLKNRDRLANFINCDPEDVVFAENVTEGINDVMWSLPLTKDDGVLVTSVGYNSVNAIASEVCKVRGATYHEVPLLFPLDSPGEVLTPEAMVKLYADYINDHRDIKIAIVDHITSSSALLMPVKEVIEFCHSKGVEVLVDAAHAPGQLKMDMTELDPDYYTGNMHKWCHTPRGCAFLYIAKHNQANIKPVRCTKFQNENLWYQFAYQGTRDYTPYCCVTAGIDFLNMCGGLDAVTAYNTALRDEAQELLATTWGTPILPVSKELTAPFMCLIKMPNKYDECPQTLDTILTIQEEIYKEHNVVFVVHYHQGRMFCRIGANIYNTIEDYKRLAKAVLEWDPKKHDLAIKHLK